MRFRLDAWESDYAFPFEPPEAPDRAALASVDVTVEAPAHEWVPITPDPSAGTFDVVRFVDGVQSSDAVIWIAEHETDEPQPGLVASWAAGVLRCSADGAVLEEGRVKVKRGVFSDARSLGPIIAGNLAWHPQPPDDPLAEQPASGSGLDPSADAMALRERLGTARRRLEDAVGQIHRGNVDDDSLVVYDGLLHGAAPAMGAVGLAKRAHRVYLPPELQRVQRLLRGGQRTPLFSTDPQRRKLSFYLALADPKPAAVADPGSCVSRIELLAAADATPVELSRFADRVALTLPAFASEPHMDPRAPQNLLPIKSLETHLRRMLGRPSVIRPLLASQAAVSA